MRSPPAQHRSLGRTLAALCWVWFLPHGTWAADSTKRALGPVARSENPPALRSEKIAEATLLVSPDSLTAAVAVTALVRAPQVTPSTPLPAAGLRHLLEHVLMDPSHPAGARAMQLRAQGWRVQAFTTPEYTAYQVVGDRTRLGDALQFVHALLSTPPLPEGREAEARLAQHRQALSLSTALEPSSAAPLQRLFASAFGERHPGARPIVGSPEQLASLSASALREHWQQSYRPPALTLILSGGLDAAALSLARSGLTELDAHIARTRGRLSNPAAWPPPRAVGTVKSPPAESHRPGPQLLLLPPVAEKSGGDAQSTWLAFALDGATPHDLAAMEVAAQLGLSLGGTASLIPGPGQSPSLWVLRIPNTASDPADSVRAAVDAICRLADSVTDELVAQARRRVSLDIAQRAETPAGQGLRIASLWLAGLDEAIFQQRLLSLSAADLRRALARFLQVDRVSLLLPTQARFSLDARAALERRVREQLHTLSSRSAQVPPATVRSGAVAQPVEAAAKAMVLQAQTGAHIVLLPEARPSPLSASKRVALTALWPGGRHREDPRQRGLHDLLVRVWPRATTALPSARFAALSADLHLSLGAETSDDAFALRMQLPSENVPQGLALLRDCIESPAISEADVERARRDVVLSSRRPPLRDLAPRAQRSATEIDAARFAWQLFQAGLHRTALAQPASSPKLSGTSRPAAAAYEDLAATVAVLTTRQLQEKLRTYTHSSLVLALVGDFDPHAVVAQLSPWLGAVSVVGEPTRGASTGTAAASDAAPAMTSTLSSERGADAQTFAFAPTQQAHLVLGAAVPGCSVTRGARRSPAFASTQAALSLLLELLASESGIGQAQQALLSRRALAFTVEGIRTGCVPDSTLALYVATTPRNLDAAEASLRDELRRFLDHPPDANALALARERLASRWVLASQRRSDRALQLARGLLFGQADPALGDESPADLLRKLEPETLQAVAKRYLREDQLLRAVVLPDSQRIAVGNRGVSLRERELTTAQPTGDASRRAAPPSKGSSAKSGPNDKAATKSPDHAAKRTPAVKHAAKPGHKPAGQAVRRIAGKPPQRL